MTKDTHKFAFHKTTDAEWTQKQRNEAENYDQKAAKWVLPTEEVLTAEKLLELAKQPALQNVPHSSVKK